MIFVGRQLKVSTFHGRCTHCCPIISHFNLCLSSTSHHHKIINALLLIFWQLFRWLPWFESTVLKPIHDNDFHFLSDEHIANIRAPVLIMHAQNDRVVPLELGYMLYRKALETRGKAWGPVEFHRFKGKYGHKYIVRAHNFADIVDQFIKRYQDETY